MSGAGNIVIGERVIDAAAESAHMHAAVPATAGAVVCFSGTVRGGKVLSLTLEHYPGMTETVLRQIAEQAQNRWPLLAVRIVHRVGRMRPGDIIVFVAATAAHRADAFAACACMMDNLKTQAPFWKKEETAAGTHWVEARDSDEQARRRWESS